jgi:hypothetical protein
MEHIFMARGLPTDTICLDGAATTHMVPLELQQRSGILQGYQTFKTPRVIEVGGGHQLRSFGQGQLVIGKYKLYAITVDQLQFILLSEPQIVVKGGSVVAKDMEKIFYDDKGEVIIRAPLDRQVYAFSVDTDREDFFSRQ